MQSAQEQKFRTMTETPVKKLVCKLAVPTIISMLVTSFYNMADTFFVGRIGTSASAAVGVVFSLMAIIQATGFFFGHGSGNFISRALGRHDNETAGRMAATGFFSALITGTVIMVLGLTFLEPLARLLGSTETILPYAMDYMRIILIGAPYMCASLVLNNQLRFQGNAVYGMVGITSGAVLNIALDPLLIFVFDMGIAGAALATIISQFVGFILLLIGTHRGDAIAIRLRNFKPSRMLYKEILRGGAPSLLRQGLGSVATISLNFSAGIYGDAAIAGMSIVTRIMQFAYSCLIGFGQGFQPVCGFNYGAKKYDRVCESMRFTVGTTVLYSAAVWALAMLIPSPFIRIFSSEPEIIAAGVPALRLYFCLFVFMALQMSSQALIVSLGRSKQAIFFSLFRKAIINAPLTVILPSFMGVSGVFAAEAVSQLLGGLASSITMYFTVYRRLKRSEAI